MAQWGNNDNAANSVIWVGEGINQNVEVGSANVANQTTMFNNATQDQFVPGIAVGQFGVDPQEQAAARGGTVGKPAHAGWVKRVEGSGGRAGRVTYEVLVAMSSMTGDSATDDDVMVDYTLQILTQPVDNSDVTGNSASFTVSVVSIPDGATIGYQWQVSPNTANTELWSDISEGGVYSGSNTTTLSISDNTGLNANAYRVRVSTTGAANVISDHAFIYETA